MASVQPCLRPEVVLRVLVLVPALAPWARLEGLQVLYVVGKRSLAVARVAFPAESRSDGHYESFSVASTRPFDGLLET